jgi:hypothetical protein
MRAYYSTRSTGQRLSSPRDCIVFLWHLLLFFGRGRSRSLLLSCRALKVGLHFHVSCLKTAALRWWETQSAGFASAKPSETCYICVDLLSLCLFFPLSPLLLRPSLLQNRNPLRFFPAWTENFWGLSLCFFTPRPRLSRRHTGLQDLRLSAPLVCESRVWHHLTGLPPPKGGLTLWAVLLHGAEWFGALGF